MSLSLQGVFLRPPACQVRSRVKIARALLLIVCSPHELEVSAKGQLNFLVITGGVRLSGGMPGAQPRKDSQGLVLILRATHALKKPAKAETVRLVIFFSRAVMGVKMLEKR